MKHISTSAKERPILFTPAMAAKCHDGSKTQTRRVVKPQPEKWIDKYELAMDHDYWIPSGVFIDDPTGFLSKGRPTKIRNNGQSVKCPYGQPGDRLWVRESCRIYDWTEDGEPFVKYHDEAVRLCRVPEEETDRWADYWATLALRDNFNIDGRASERKWRPNIHMPRWACRTVLEVTRVRVERVEGIRTEDSIAEGFDNNTHFLNTFYKINKRAPEGSNPWVWVIEFEKMAGAA